MNEFSILIGGKAGFGIDKLPDSWTCPECGVGKDMFEKIE